MHVVPNFLSKLEMGEALNGIDEQLTNMKLYEVNGVKNVKEITNEAHKKLRNIQTYKVNTIIVAKGVEDKVKMKETC